MATWFECKVRYDKIIENGLTKKVTEPYLVDALSFTEAEERIIREASPFITGEFTIADIKRANYAEVIDSIDNNADRWFKCKVLYISLDEKTGKEKNIAQLLLVKATDLRQAIDHLEEYMEKGLGDYRLASVTETAILDVYPYESEPKAKPEFPEAGE